MAPYAAQLSYQVCPIILTGGVAAQIPGGMLPMISMFVSGQTNSLGLPYDIGKLDDAFGAFNILPGGNLVSQTIGKYPFANQSVAANAVIREPLTLSVIMDAPMRGPNAWNVKQAVFTALKSTLDIHNNGGGTYTVATPAYMYDNLIMVALTDNSRGNNSLPQNAWRFDFEKPLVSLAELQGAQNQFLQKITNGLPTDAGLSGINPGLLSGQVPLAQTIKAAGGLSGGTPSVINIPATPGVANYPAIPNVSNFPYAGIS
jgi:hypothetical protein